MPEDGECGYHTLGIPRHVIVEQLLNHAGDENIRSLVMPEIMAAVFDNGLPREFESLNDPSPKVIVGLENPEKSANLENSEKSKNLESGNIAENSEAEDPTDLPESFKTHPDTAVLYHTYRQYLKKEKELSTFINSIKDKLSVEKQNLLNGLSHLELLASPSFPDEAKEALKLKIHEVNYCCSCIENHCASRPVFEAYVRHYIQQPGKWLTFFTYKNGVPQNLTTSSLNAIAKINNLEVVVWKDESPSNLFGPYYCKGNPGATLVNMYHCGNHFNRLDANPNLVMYPLKNEARIPASSNKVTINNNSNSYAPIRLPLKARITAFRQSHAALPKEQMLQETAKMYADDALLLGLDWNQAFKQFYDYDPNCLKYSCSPRIILPQKNDALIDALDNVFQSTYPVKAAALQDRIQQLRKELGIQTLSSRIENKQKELAKHAGKTRVASLYADEASVFLKKKREYAFKEHYDSKTVEDCRQLENAASDQKETLLSRGECFYFAKQRPKQDFQADIKMTIKRRGTQLVVTCKLGSQNLYEKVFDLNATQTFTDENLNEGFTFSVNQGRLQLSCVDR